MKKHGEMRQDRTTGQWVIYAPARRKRPKDFRQEQREASPLPRRDPACPFCPGNESTLPRVLFELRGRGQRWRTRVVPNKFPALSPSADIRRHCRGIHVTMGGFGHHEVVIETPRHDRDLGVMSTGEVAAVIETYHRRYRDLIAGDENMMVIIFRNHGKRAGTSLIHPHSQIIATGVVPKNVRWREERAQQHYDEWGRCVFCDALEEELRNKTRMVMRNRSFAAFVPFAAEVPFEIWIMPRRHTADFGDATERERLDLARALRSVLGFLRERLEDPDYNFVINTSARYRAQEPQLHWYLQIRPRLTARAGFEIGSGMSINPSMPEEDAAFLRS